MKKTVLIILAAFLLSVVLTVLLLPGNYGTTAIIDGVDYGMTPRQVRSVLGEPGEIIEPNRELSLREGVRYVYMLEIEGCTAKTVLGFVRIGLHQELCEFYVKMDCGDDDMAAAVAAKLLNIASDTYEGSEGYYYRKGGDTGINHGAVGLYFTVKAEHERVTADGYCNDYDERWFNFLEDCRPHIFN